MVWVVEGEKDADGCWERGLPATCNLGGAGKWRAEETQALVDLGVTQVYVVPDADVPGRRHAQSVVERLTAAGVSAVLVALPGLSAHGDVSDWWAAGGTVRALEGLALAAVAEPPGAPVEAEAGLVPEVLHAEQSFTRLGEGRYELEYPSLGIRLEANQVHRDRGRGQARRAWTGSVRSKPCRYVSLERKPRAARSSRWPTTRSLDPQRPGMCPGCPSCSGIL